VSGRLAITPGFEAPPVQLASAAAPVLQTTAARSTSPKAASQTKVPSAFADLIQEFAHEAASRLAVASPKTAPRTVQQATAGAGEPTPELPAAKAGPAAPATVELSPLPQLAPSDGRTAARQSKSAETTVESTPDVPAKDGDKPAIAPPPAPWEGTRRQPKSDASVPRENSAPVTIDVAIFLPVAPPISLKLPSFLTHLGEGSGDGIHTGGHAPRALPTSNPAREQTLNLRPAPALELKIRALDQPASEQEATAAPAPTSKPVPTEQQTDGELPSTVSLGMQPRAAEQILHAFASAPGPAAIESVPPQPTQTTTIAMPPTPVNPPPVINTNASSAPAPPPRPPAAHLADEPVSHQPEQHAQPLRSLSLEFAPDGAQDVRVRVEERAGDVHISLHSTDPALSGRLSDGVHELVGTLASAGYDAQAWTNGQGRQSHSEQNQAPPDDPRRNRRGNSADAGEEDFDALMQQPIRIKP
jgi:hypothetical protein